MSTTEQQQASGRKQLRAQRQVFWDSWQKAQADLPLNALEVRIARVINMHAEFHHYFDDMEDFLDRDFQVNDGMNPYLHLSLHLTLEDMVATKQPVEVAQALEKMIFEKKMDRHDALHLILDVLAETLHQAQRAGQEWDYQAFCYRVKELIKI